MTHAVQSLTIDIDGPLHYLEYDGPTDGPTFVCIHALAAHHGTWVALAPLLAQRGRVLVPDMPGFGLSPLNGRRATLAGHRDILRRFLAATTDGPVVLVGNSMGGATALLQAFSNPSAVAGTVLLAPAIAATRLYLVEPKFIALFGATMGPTRALQAAARRTMNITPERFVVEMIKACAADPTRVPREVVEASTEVARARLENMAEGVTAFVQAARSVTRFVLRPRRYLGMVGAVPSDALLLLGSADRLVPARLAEPVMATRPDWTMGILDGMGHMPQIEEPATVVEHIDAWLAAGAIRPAAAAG